MTGDLRRICVVLSGGSSCRACSGRRSCSAWFPAGSPSSSPVPAGPVASSQGGQVTAAIGYDAAVTPGIMLIPGGQGTRRLVTDEAFLSWLRAWATPASVVTSVCTGSAALAAAGLLDGYRATSNKAAFAWAREQSGKAGWIAQARWVQDRDGGHRRVSRQAWTWLRRCWRTCSARTLHTGPRPEPSLRYTKMHRGTPSPGSTVSPNKQRSPGALRRRDGSVLPSPVPCPRVVSRCPRALSPSCLGSLDGRHFGFG